MHKINLLDDILRCEDETLKIVEAIAEHDFCFLRLIVTISALGIQVIYFVHSAI